MTRITLPKWYDLHTHFRQGDSVSDYIKDHLAMGCAGALAMPNTKPPVAVVFEEDENGEYWSIERYRRDLMAAGADAFDALITPLYLTKDTTPEMIERGAEAGLLQACKYYPPHGTTGAEFGQPLGSFIENGVFKVMEKCGVTLCIHGEKHGLEAVDYFDRSANAEDRFYREDMPDLISKHAGLKIVCEHVTTKTAVDFVKRCGSNVGATITPQHLLYTIGDLVKGLNYHLYCLPLLKFEEDRAALREAVLDAGNTKFFAGTDSAPHAEKVTECGCAAGCYTGGIAPQLYAQVLGDDIDAFRRFLCENGARFYGLDVSRETFSLVREGRVVQKTCDAVPLPLGLGKKTLSWSIESI